MSFLLASIECPKCGTTAMVLLDEAKKTQSQLFDCPQCEYSDRMHVSFMQDNEIQKEA